MLSLLYISRSLLDEAAAERELADILATGVARNLAAGVTGALIHTGASFAQILEGPQAAVEDIMASILIDRRHEDVEIVRRAAVSERRFPNWGLVLVDREVAANLHIAAIRMTASQGSFDAAVGALVDLMERSATARF